MSCRIARAPTAFQGPQKGTVDEPKESPAYLRWLRQQPCIVSGGLNVVAHHVRLERAADGGLRGGLKAGVRVSDFQCVPLRYDLHDNHPGSLHVLNNEKEWWLARSIDPLIVAAVFAAMWRHRVKAISTEQFDAIKRLAAAK